MLIQSLMNEGQSSAQIGFTMTAIGVAKGLVFTVLGALLARRLHYRPGIAWLAAAAIGAIGYILTIGTTVWHASKFETPPDWLMMTLVSSLIITVIVSALAGLIATLLPFFKPKPDPTSAFD
jgi:peptidoglycan/LPS O-acetylase OafA/YrhL